MCFLAKKPNSSSNYNFRISRPHSASLTGDRPFLQSGLHFARTLRSNHDGIPWQHWSTRYVLFGASCIFWKQSRSLPSKQFFTIKAVTSHLTKKVSIKFTYTPSTLAGLSFFDHDDEVAQPNCGRRGSSSSPSASTSSSTAAAAGSGSQDGMLCLWDAMTGACLYRWVQHKRPRESFRSPYDLPKIRDKFWVG